MIDWVESVNKVKKYLESPQSQREANKVDALTLVSALRGWLNSEVTEYTEGSYEGVSRRLVWVYPDGYSLTSGSNDVLALTHMNMLLDGSENVIPKSLNPKSWNFNKNINGWSHPEIVTDEELLKIVETITNVHGVPKLVLPWESWAEQTTDDEDYLTYWEDHEEKLPIREAFYNLMVIVQSGKIKTISPWETLTVASDDYLSEHCDYTRFFNLVNTLEESGEWLVIIDEHCAACSTGTRKYMIEENPKLANAPEFLTWGQNSQDTWLPDGSFWAEVWIDSFEDEKKIKTLANQHGFDIEIPDNEDNAEGAITFG